MKTFSPDLIHIFRAVLLPLLSHLRMKVFVFLVYLPLRVGRKAFIFPSIIGNYLGIWKPNYVHFGSTL